jgi:Winged helix DNA-binding domain
MGSGRDSVTSTCLPGRGEALGYDGPVSDGRRDIAEQRLRNQRLSGPPLEAVADVVRWFGGMQFQEYPVGRWSIGQRSVDLTEAAIDRALAEAAVVRTHVLRDTWHLVTAEDLRWMMALTGPRIHQRNATMYRRSELDEQLLARTDALLGKALTGGQQLTRREIAALLARSGITANGLRLGYILMHAEIELVICSGALHGKQQTYGLVDERVPPEPSMPRDQALAELVRRYFVSHGPATVKDFSWWSSLTTADTKRGLELVGDALESRIVEGVAYWCGPGLPARVDPPRAHLLQGYDEYAIAYSESRRVLDIEGHAGSVLAGDGMFTHAVLLDGQVVGRWRRRPGSRTVSIGVQLGRPLDAAATEAVDHAVQRYGEFVGSAITWST